MAVLARLQSLTKKTSLKNIIHHYFLLRNRRRRRWRLFFRNLSVKNLTRPIRVTNVPPAHDDYSYGIVFGSTDATILIFQKTSYATFSPHTLITFSSDEPCIPDLCSCYRKLKNLMMCMEVAMIPMRMTMTMPLWWRCTGGSHSYAYTMWNLDPTITLILFC